MDGPELESHDEVVAGVWKKRQMGERVPGKDEGSDRSSNTEGKDDEIEGSWEVQTSGGLKAESGLVL